MKDKILINLTNYQLGLSEALLKKYDLIILNNLESYNIKKIMPKLRSLKQYESEVSVNNAYKHLKSLTSFKINNQPVSESINYRGYPLWWCNYDTIHRNLCLPITKYQKLLKIIGQYKYLDIYVDSNEEIIFKYFCQAYKINISILNKKAKKYNFGLIVLFIISLFSFFFLL